MSEWRTIDSAPKDGTEILLWTPEGIDVSCWSELEEDGQQSMGHDAGFCGLLTCADPGRHMGNPEFFREAVNQPTHWMPLPEPPK